VNVAVDVEENVAVDVDDDVEVLVDELVLVLVEDDVEVDVLELVLVLILVLVAGLRFTRLYEGSRSGTPSASPALDSSSHIAGGGKLVKK
jgi:hypothetical protein